MKKAISFVVVSLLMAACGHSPIQPSRVPATPPAPVTYSLAGTVSEATADGPRGVAEAVVVIGNDSQSQTVSTDENGAFSLEGINAGAWQLSVTKDGYETQTMTLDIQASQTISVELKVAEN